MAPWAVRPVVSLNADVVPISSAWRKQGIGGTTIFQKIDLKQ